MKRIFLKIVSPLTLSILLAIFMGNLTLERAICVASPRRTGGLLKKILLSNHPAEIQLVLSSHPEYKVIQTDAREIIIALKNISFSKSLKASGHGKPFVQSVVFEKLQRNITVLTIHTQRPLEGYRVDWKSAKSALIVKLRSAKSRQHTKRSLKRQTRRTKRKPAPVFSRQASPPTRAPRLSPPSVKHPPQPISLPAKGPYQAPPPLKPIGSAPIDDIITRSKAGQCTGHRGFEEALNYFKKNQWKRAYDAFNQLMQMDSVSTHCLERAHFLRAYSHFKYADPEDPKQYRLTESLLHDTLSYYPNSKLIPFSLSALGKLYHKTGDLAEARGYFQVLQDQYKGFEGYPEILYELGRLRVEQSDYKHAQPYFNKIIKHYPQSTFVTDAKIELAKTLYATHRFRDSLKLLRAIQDENPRKMFESSDFLLQMGNAYYHAQQYAEARRFLEKAYNFFHDLKAPDETLARIGDTYVEQNQIDKAKKIFTLVTEKYPGTNGFILSSIRLAENIKDNAKKRKLYQLIIDDYSDNPMAKLAMLRLAKVQNDEGEYEDSIETLKELLGERSRAIRRDAIALMEKSYLQLFEKLMAANDYPGILLRFEKDKLRIINFENADILMWVGNAYQNGHLNEQAAEIYERIHDQFPAKEYPKDLLYRYGSALHDSGKPEKAAEMLNAFVKSSKNRAERCDAYLRIGKILMSQKSYPNAIPPLTQALTLAQAPPAQAEILTKIAQAEHELKAYDKEIINLRKAVDRLPNITPQTTDIILNAYQNMGEAYTQLHALTKAAESFQNAIKVAEQYNLMPQNAKERKKVENVYFKLGETYERDKKKTEAIKVFKKLAASEDPFWARLAQEKLRGIDIEKRHRANENA